MQSGCTIDVSAGLLERIRAAWRLDEGVCGSDMDTEEAPQGSQTLPTASSGDWMGAQLGEALVLTMEELESQGFQPACVQSAVLSVLSRLESRLNRQEAVWDLFHDEQRGGVRRGVAGLAGMLREAALNYLLARLDRDQLPEYYAGTSRMVDQGRVVSVGARKNPVEGRASEQSAEGVRRERDAQEARRRQQEIEAQEASKRLEELHAQQEAEEAARRKAWILQQAMSSEDDNGDDWDASEEEASGDSDIEDWELWGSREEISKKREEKARRELRREDKLVLIAREMRGAKAGVAKAKREGDKAALKGFGVVIGRLRREMGELGINDEELDAVEVDEEGPSEGAGQSSSPSPLPESSPSSPSCSSSSSGDAFGLDMFEEMGASEPADATKVNPLYACIVRQLTERRAVQAPGKAAGNGRHGAKQQTKHQLKENKRRMDARKHPKALLQQLAQREGWGAPRFEKLPSGGERNPQGGIRFQALIDIKGSSSKANKANTRLGVHRFVLSPELDGWNTVTEAQDAVSTKALMDLFGASAAQAALVDWDLLKAPFDDFVMEVALWEGDCGLAAKEDMSRARSEFVARALSASRLRLACSFEGDGAREALKQQHAVMDEAMTRAMAQRKDQLARPSVSAQSEALASEFRDWNSSDIGKYWREKRDGLPVTQIRDELLRVLGVHDVVLVSGETGSGKTTQVPQMLLDGCLETFRGAQCSIVCTQPRRIAAISVADRVSEERGEAGPGKKGSAVGYSVRFDSATNATTRLEFCTTGILLRRLSSDPALLKLSHVVVDEVHERTMQSDFLIAMLRDLVGKRRRAGLPLKVILMSATMNTEVIADYFAGCPVLGASGRTFPVQHLFLEDVYEATGYVLDAESSASLRDYQSLRDGQKKLENSAGSKNKALLKSNWGDQTSDVILNPNVDAASLAAMLDNDQYSPSTVRNMSRVNEERIDMDLVEHVVLHIHNTQDPGAILVFVPGMAEIDNLTRRLVSQRCLKGHVVVPLHSSISPKDQKSAFKLHGDGVRKIVISTNIAETSVTIEDVVYVIDTGKHKERRHDASRSMSMLVEDLVSVANANQRKGRAGRVREGTCYALYTRQCYEKRMKKYQTPEIMRVPLEEMILQIHHLRLSSTADEFLAKVLQPPHKKAVEGATGNLIQAGALTKAEELTALGSHLAALPVDVNIGKILIMGVLLQCLSPALSIAACLSHKSPFAAFQDKEDIRAARAPFVSKDRDPNRSVAAGQQSDHLVLAAALQGWIDAKASGGMSMASKYAKNHRLSIPNVNTIMDMRDQFAGMLESAGLAQRGDEAHAPVKGQGCKWYDDERCPQNTHKSSPEVILAVLVASLYPSIALVDEVVQGCAPTWHDGQGSVSIHPTSMLSDVSAAALLRPFVVYSEKMKTSRVFLRDCSVASPLPILLFGRQVVVDHRSSVVVVDGWIKLRVTGRCSALLMAVREKLEELLRSKVQGGRGGGRATGSKGAKDADSGNGGDGGDGVDCLSIITSLLKEEAVMHKWKS